MRGVFFVVFLLICSPSVGEGVKITGELEGSVGTKGLEQEFHFEVRHKLSHLHLELGYEFKFTNKDLISAPRYKLRFDLMENSTDVRNVQLVLNHNYEHYSSLDLFRLIHKDNFDVDTSSFLLLSEQTQLGWLRRIPAKNLGKVDAWFYQTSLYLNPFCLRGTQLQFASIKGVGSAQVLQVEGAMGSWQAVAGLGYQIDYNETEHRGFVLEISQTNEKWNGQLTWQKVDPNFFSFLAKTNKYTPNRQGWHLKTNYSLGDLELTINRRLHSNIAQTKKYNQLSWKLGSKEKNTSLEWRLEPTQAFILRYEVENTQIQVDVLNNTLRCDWKYKQVSYGFRLDGEREIGRLELRFRWGPQWRWIVKYDFRQKRLHYSLLLSEKNKKGNLQLELGAYDRGNMAAGFNKEPHLCISWKWKF